jgi:hypothetical protein
MKTTAFILLVFISSLAAAQKDGEKLQPEQILATAKQLTDLSSSGPLNVRFQDVVPL